MKKPDRTDRKRTTICTQKRVRCTRRLRSQLRVIVAVTHTNINLRRHYYRALSPGDGINRRRRQSNYYVARNRITRREMYDARTLQIINRFGRT